MKTSCAPVISISRPLAQPKRAGPFITIRTSTFVELLGNAREWDAKFPALAGASRAYLLESFAFADDFCSYAAEEERRQRSGVLARQVKRFLLYGALFLALLSPTVASGQDDFFPPQGIVIPPCCSTGGTGHTGATYGRNGQSAWRQVWGAGPGDVVTFRFVLRSRSAGSLHAWPKTTAGTDPQYLGDPNSPYERYYWNTFGSREKGGEFCLDCPWQFVATDWNPWIYVDYFDSGDGWDIDLNIVDITTPSQQVRQIYSPAEKDNARWWRDRTGQATVYIGTVSGTWCLKFQDRFCAAGALATFMLGAISNHFGNVVADPDDPWYQYPADPDHRGWDPAAFGWGWTNDETANNLIVAAMVVGPYSWTADTTINRASTCIKYNDGCQWWQQQRIQSLHYTLGDWLRNSAQLMAGLRDLAWWEGNYELYDSFNDAASVLWGAGDYTTYTLANNGY